MDANNETLRRLDDPQPVQNNKDPWREMILHFVKLARQVDVNIIDSEQFVREHPFLHLIHSSCTVLTSSQMKSEIVNLLAQKRRLVLQLVELEAECDSLRLSLCEEEGDDETNAFCQVNYGLGDLEGDDRELALAYMNSTFKPFTFPGLDDTAHTCRSNYAE